MPEFVSRARFFVLTNQADMIVYTGFLALRRRADFPLAELVIINLTIRIQDGDAGEVAAAAERIIPDACHGF